MRRHAVTALIVAAVVLSLAPTAAANPFEHSYRNAVLLGDWWALALSTPRSKNPLGGNGNRCITLGRDVLAPAFVLGGVISCKADRYQAILPITFTSECSDVQPPPFFGATPQARRECAIAADNSIKTNQVGIDGHIYNVNNYRVQSKDRRVSLPEDDLFGTDASSANFSADGCAPLIEGLTPGDHVITVRIIGTYPGGGGPVDATGRMNLEVTRS